MRTNEKSETCRRDLTTWDHRWDLHAEFQQNDLISARVQYGPKTWYICVYACSSGVIGRAASEGGVYVYIITWVGCLTDTVTHCNTLHHTAHMYRVVSCMCTSYVRGFVAELSECRWCDASACEFRCGRCVCMLFSIFICQVCLCDSVRKIIQTVNHRAEMTPQERHLRLFASNAASSAGSCFADT